MIDYYNFDYNNEKEIEKQLDKIDKEIAFCLQNYIINIKDGKKEFNNPITLSTENGYDLSPQNPYKKGISSSYAKGCEKLFTDDFPLPEDWDTLGAAEKAFKIRDVVQRTIDKNKQAKIKMDKKLEPILKENKEHIDNIGSYLIFLLAARANELSKLDYAINEDREKIIDKSNKYLARIENLISIKNMFEGVNASILTTRDMDMPDFRIKSKIMIQYDIDTAKYRLEQAKNPTSKRYKDKKNLLFDLCQSYVNLDQDKTTIDTMIDITKALLTKEMTTAFEENEKKIAFIERLMQYDNAEENKYQATRIHLVLNEELAKKTSRMFFNEQEDIMSYSEQLAVLQALRLSTINTLEELKDYLIANRSEIKMEKTNNGKIEITIGRSGEIDSKLSSSINSETENKFIGSNSTITYVYDPINRELEGYKLSGQFYAFSKDINNEIGRTLSNQFNLFLGNLEASTNVPVITLFNAQIPIPSVPSIDAEILKIKDKITKKFNKDFSIDFTTKADVGKVKFGALSIKPTAVELSIMPEINVKNYKIKLPKISETVKSIINDGKSFSELFSTSIASVYFNATMDGFINDLKVVLGKSENKLKEINYNKSTNSLEFINPSETLKDKAEMFEQINEKIRLLRSVITNESSIVSDILQKNPDLMSSDFESKSYLKQLYEAFVSTIGSFKDIKELFASIIDSGKNIEESAKNIREKTFSELFNNFRKNDSIFVINGTTTIDDALLNDRILLSLSLNMDDTDNLKTVSTLLKNTKEPEIFANEIRNAINNMENIDNKTYLQNIYSSVIKTHAEELIRTKNEDKIYNLLLSNKFNKEILLAFKSVKKMEAIPMLSNLLEKSKEKNDKLPLEDIIEKYKKGIEKYSEKQIGTQER